MPHPTSLIDELIKNKIILKDLKKKQTKMYRIL